MMQARKSDWANAFLDANVFANCPPTRCRAYGYDLLHFATLVP